MLKGRGGFWRIKSIDRTMSEQPKRVVGALLFPDFELLDIFGPLEMLGVLKDHFEIVVVAEHAGSVPSAQGPECVATFGFEQCPPIDVLLVPGGSGTRKEADNPAMMAFLRTAYPNLEILASICTGAGLLAAAGLIDGRRATSNKMSFEWVVSRGPNVDWVPEARWIEDGNVVTAGGVAAGIDMSLGLVRRLVGEEVAERVAQYTEYDWHTDPTWDPFAKLAGLV